MNATDVIGWGWGLGKDSFGNPSAQTRNKKDLAASNVSIFVGGGGAQPGGRQSFQSLRRERWRARFPVLPGGKESVQSRGGGSAVLLGGAPLTPYLFWSRHGGLRSWDEGSTPGPEVYVKLRQPSGRHFNCGLLQDRGPLAALQGGEIAPSVSVSPFPASRQVLPLPRPLAPVRDVFSACSCRGCRGHATR